MFEFLERFSARDGCLSEIGLGVAGSDLKEFYVAAVRVEYRKQKGAYLNRFVSFWNMSELL